MQKKGPLYTVSRSGITQHIVGKTKLEITYDFNYCKDKNQKFMQKFLAFILILVVTESMKRKIFSNGKSF